MKFLTTVCLLFLILKTNAQNVKLNLYNFPKNKKIYLHQRESFKNTIIDSFYMVGKQLSKQITEKQTHRYFITIQGDVNTYIPFISNAPVITIQYLYTPAQNIDIHWPLNYILKGGNENVIMNKLVKQEHFWKNKLYKIFDKRDAVDRKKDSLLYSSLVDSVYFYNIKRDEALYNFIASHPNSFVTLDFYSREVNRLPYIPKLRDAFKLLSPRLQNTADGKWISTILFPKISIGQDLIDIKNIDTLGKPVNLAAYKGKIILLDFWASWCGPCLEDYKLLKPLYAKYKNTGFEVFAVSVDDDQLKWKQTIRNNAYPWINVIDHLGPNAKAVGDYGIYKYPSNYLIDIDGKIVEKDIDMEDLETFLKKRNK